MVSLKMLANRQGLHLAVFENRPNVTEDKFITKSSSFILFPALLILSTIRLDLYAE